MKKVEKGKSSIDKIGLIYAINGIKYAWKHERNLRIHCIIAILVGVVAWFFSLSTTENLILILTVGLMLFAEMINSAIEKTVDLICEDTYNEKAKQAKDMAAGAVLVCSVVAVIVGVIIFLPKLIAFILSIM